MVVGHVEHFFVDYLIFELGVTWIGWFLSCRSYQFKLIALKTSNLLVEGLDACLH